MTAAMWEVFLVAVLAVLAIWAGVRMAAKAQRGGGCCGEHQPAEKSTPVSDRDRSHYSCVLDLTITGMNCSNCANKIENALNALDGVWATVDLHTHTAHLLLKNEPDVPLLCATVARVGYVAKAKDVH